MLHARNDFMKKLIISDTLDWKSKDVNAVYNAIISGARNGSIILCHDIYKTTVDAVEKVIPKLIEKGYQLVTISELMSFSDTIVSSGGLYRKR